MGDDHERTVHDSGVRQERGNSAATQKVNEGVPDQSREDSKGKDGGEENQPRDGGSEKLLAAANLIKSASEDDLIEAGVISGSETEMMSVAFSGMLPHPSIYRMYDAETRERMCRWNDAYTIDESKRQDKLTDFEIKSRILAQRISALLMVFAFICAVITYVVYHDPIFSGAFIAVPFITVLANGVQAIMPKRKADDDSPEKEH